MTLTNDIKRLKKYVDLFNADGSRQVMIELLRRNMKENNDFASCNDRVDDLRTHYLKQLETLETQYKTKFKQSKLKI